MSSSKLVPANPESVTVWRNVTPSIMTFSAPFNRFGMIKIGGRGTIVKLASGNLALFSPLAPTTEAKQKLKEFGTVKYIAALDMEHHIFLGPWHAEYPDAKVLAPDGLPEKRTKQKNEDVRFDVLFKASNKEAVKVDDEFDSEFDYEFVDGHGNQELVFNHRPSRTLIQGDLIFNLPALEQYSKSPENPHTGFLTKLFGNINNTAGAALAQRRFIWYMISAGNRTSYNKSMGKIDAWNFDRIIPCHGDVIETDGKGVFRKIMGWHLDALRRQEQATG